MRCVEVPGRNGLTFVPDAMTSNNTPASHKEPKHPGVQLPNVAQLKQSIIQRLGQWFTMVLAVLQLFQARRNGRKIIGIAGLEFQQELPHRRISTPADVTFYAEFHKLQHQL